MFLRILETVESTVTVVVETPLPVEESDYAGPGKDFLENCISADIWTPYQGEAHQIDERGCWQLHDWGITAIDQSLSLEYQQPGGSRTRGIYTAIPEQTRIDFKIRIDHLDSNLDFEPAVTIGFVPTPGVNPNLGEFLLFKLELSGQDDAYVKLLHPNDQEEYLPLRYNYGDTWNVTLLLERQQLQIFINGNLIENNINLPASNNVFWLGYQIPTTGEISAFIFDLSITDR